MKAEQEYDRILSELKKVSPVLPGGDELADRIIFKIKGESGRSKFTKVISILRIASASAAAALVFLFFQQTFFYNSTGVENNRFGNNISGDYAGYATELAVENKKTFDLQSTIRRSHSAQIEGPDLIKAILLETRKRELQNRMVKTLISQYTTRL